MVSKILGNTRVCTIRFENDFLLNVQRFPHFFEPEEKLLPPDLLAELKTPAEEKKSTGKNLYANIAKGRKTAKIAKGQKTAAYPVPLSWRISPSEKKVTMASTGTYVSTVHFFSENPERTCSKTK